MLDLPTLHRRASRVLPASLRTRGVLTQSESPRDLAALLLPLRHTPRGSVWFRLEDATARAWREDPAHCLDSNVVARAGLGRHASPMRYRDWDVVAAAPSAIYRAQSRDRRARLWVLPAQGLVVYDWDDGVSGGDAEDFSVAREMDSACPHPNHAPAWRSTPGVR